MGKIGRTLDLAEYLDKYGIISVAKYMNRYGVGQLRAIKELNASHFTYSTTGKSAKRKKDTYIISTNEDTILAIQNDIGYTPAGFPYALYEQIAEWIQNPLYLEGYPAWIKECGSQISGSLTSSTKEKNKKTKKQERRDNEDNKHTERISSGSQFDLL